MRFAGMTGVRRFCLYFIHLYIIFHLHRPWIFTAAAASLCVQVKGAIPSMPDRTSVLHLLQTVWSFEGFFLLIVKF
jgi:hypothetical protein